MHTAEAAVHYTSSNGKIRPIADMMDGHLHNALAKLERDEPHRGSEIAAMRAEVAKRDAMASEHEQ